MRARAEASSPPNRHREGGTVPVVALDCVAEKLSCSIVKLLVADDFVVDVLEELDVVITPCELVPLEHLTETAPAAILGLARVPGSSHAALMAIG